jgi:hypothetical protein
MMITQAPKMRTRACTHKHGRNSGTECTKQSVKLGERMIQTNKRAIWGGIKRRTYSAHELRPCKAL